MLLIAELFSTRPANLNIQNSFEKVAIPTVYFHNKPYGLNTIIP